MSRHSARGPAWERVRRAVLVRDGWTCHYCGARATEVDHVLAISKGGPALDPRNLVACCVTCNRKKGDRPSLTTSPLHGPAGLDEHGIPKPCRCGCGAYWWGQPPNPHSRLWFGDKANDARWYTS